MDILVEALDQKDGFMRFHVIAALEKIHRIKPELLFNRQRIESSIREESTRYALYRQLYHVLFESQRYSPKSLLACTTVEKMKRGMDRIYRLLSLLYSWKDIVAAKHTIEHGDSRSRAGTLEYLDNILTGDLRRILIPLLEDTLPEKRRFSVNGGRIDGEAAVTRLIKDKDQILASTAIYFVWREKLLNFTDELERVLATRDERDRYVLETAAWVLNELHTPHPKRRRIQPEPLPSVGLVDQMRNLRLFSSVTVDEIFRICETGRQVHFEPGSLLCREGLVPERVQFLLNGHVDVTGSDGRTRHIKAPAVLGFQEVLEERPMKESVRAIDMSVCLTLTSEEVQVLMSDNSNLVPGLFQMLCLDLKPGRWVVKGFRSLHSALPANGGLNPIEKGLVIRDIPVFSRVSPDEIIHLASIATEMCLMADSDLISEASQPAIYALISGELSLERSGKFPVMAGPSDVIGIYETLAGIDFDFRARVREDGVALRIDREDLFDLLTQRSVLLRQVFSALFGNWIAMDQTG
jgi:CRP-like cAMP-binding protein